MKEKISIYHLPFHYSINYLWNLLEEAFETMSRVPWIGREGFKDRSYTFLCML